MSCFVVESMHFPRGHAVATIPDGNRGKIGSDSEKTGFGGEKIGFWLFEPRLWSLS